MQTINRRNFIKASTLTAAAFSLPARSWSRVIGANDDIRIAVAGFNGRGKDHIEGFRKLPGVRVVALCDADRNVLESEAQKFRNRSESIETYTDIRKLLEDQNIDAVATATPNHWHALPLIWACQAGKMFMSRNRFRTTFGKAARLWRRPDAQTDCQTGTQNRSSPGCTKR